MNMEKVIVVVFLITISHGVHVVYLFNHRCDLQFYEECMWVEIPPHSGLKLLFGNFYLFVFLCEIVGIFLSLLCVLHRKLIPALAVHKP